MKQKNVLIITSSGGGGLLQAAVAKEQQLVAQDPSVCVIKRDVLKDWYGKHLGAFSVRQWDSAQQAGDIKKLSWLYNMQPWADFFFWPQVFFCAVSVLFKHSIDRVLDTQPLGTSAVLCALRLYNFFTKRDLFLEKIAVDFPTSLNTHYFCPIKKLSYRNRRRLRLITISPLLRPGQTADDFWLEYCNLLERDVVYEPVMREHFHKFRGVRRDARPLILRMRVAGREEQLLIAQTVSRGSLQADVEEQEARYVVNPFDFVVTVLLGSQPTKSATFNYVKKFVQLARSFSEKVLLFVFCAHHRTGERSVLDQIARFVNREEHYPRNLTIIPFSMQGDEVIAPLFHRSDITCTRSGGQTATEVMCVTQGDIWIHSEVEVSPGEVPSRERLLEGIFGWEAGNALYLSEKIGAKIVTPEMVPSLIQERRRSEAKEA